MALVRVELIETRPKREEVLAQRGLLRADRRFLELRHGDRHEDAQNRHDHEKLDESETSSSLHHQSLYFVLSRPVSGDREYTS